MRVLLFILSVGMVGCAPLEIRLGRNIEVQINKKVRPDVKKKKSVKNNLK